ncbi:MAG: zinc-dependent metalloprotease, partial [Planctomycetota bacterium]
RIYQKKGKVLFEIPKSLMKKEFFLATTWAGGNMFHGWQWSDQLVFFEKFEDKLLLVQKDVHYRAKKGSSLEEAVRRTYSNRIVVALPILGKAKGAGRGYLIDGKVLLANNAKEFFGAMVGDLDPGLTKFDKAKVFSDNCELAVTMPQRKGGRLITLHYSMARLPKSDYKPRLADDRIGYFLTAAKDFSEGKIEDDRFVRYVNRWDLKKKDPSLKLSPPTEPIVFYIEKTVPIRFRRYVREGILEWNKAFEAIGFDGAIEVRQQTDSNEFKDFDPEDSRYNFFRWITSEMPFAMGPSRVNPYTGEIIDADVIFDDSMARWFLTQYDLMLRGIPNTMYSPRLREYFQKFPEEHPFAGIDMKLPTVEHPAAGPLARLEASHQAASDRAFCSYGQGMTHQLALAGVALRALKKKDTTLEDAPDEYIGPVIREVVMHEIGHTLGLRHNFKASTWKSLQDINASQKDAATVGSVMDYVPINVILEGEQKQYITATIGPYDYWVIEYGYKPKQKTEDLQKIASRVAAEGLAYGTDEDVWSGDPTINRFDLATDPLDYVQARLILVRTLLPSLMARVVEEGQGYQAVRRAFDMLLYEVAFAGMTASHFIGGAYVHRDHKGDPDSRPPIQVVSADRQRQALNIVCGNILRKDAIQLSPQLLAHLAAGRWSHWGSFDGRAELNYPALERILAIQSVALSFTLNPETLGRVRNCELKVQNGEDMVTIPEIFNTLSRAVFEEVWAPSGSVEINQIRENLQRHYLGRLIRMTLQHRGGPEITQALARQQLVDIASKLEDAVSRAEDAYTKAHLEDSVRRIQKVLEANYLAG